jgi:RNase H.
MVEQVVGLEFIVTGATEATAAIKRMADSQAQLTGSISKSLGITQRVENEVRKLAKSYTDGSLNLNQYTKAVSQTANAYGVFIGSNKRARSDVAALSTAMVAEANAQKQSTQAKTAAAAVIKAESQALKDYRQARRDATAENQRYNAEAKATAQAARAVTQQEERLRLKYVQGHAAMEIYSRELNDLAMARKGDIISADQQQQAVAELNMAMAKGTGAFAGVGTAAQVGGRRMNSFGMLTQQAGYQLGDFAVQVQGGTNPMVAFGQQATQIDWCL